MLEHQLKDNTMDDAESECIACNVKRIVIAVTPVATGYEMLSLECPQCSNLLTLVYGGAYLKGALFRVHRADKGDVTPCDEKDPRPCAGGFSMPRSPSR
jgi:hypothetical protein